MSNDSTSLALPSPNDSQSQPDVPTALNVNSSLALDELGPMVINTDGTLSRIANWGNMTQAEKERTLKVLVARNRLRYEKLQNELETSAS